MKRLTKFLLAFVLSTFVLPAEAASSAETPELRVELVSDHQVLGKNTLSYLSLRFKMAKHWHIYWKNPGDSGTEPKADLENSASLILGDILWPAPKAIPVEGLTNFGYEDEVYLSMPFQIPGNLSAEEVTFKSKVDWLVCKIECIPGEAHLELTIPISDTVIRSASYGAIHEILSRVPQKISSSIETQFEMSGPQLLLYLKDSDNRLTEYNQVRFFPYQALQISNSKEQVSKKEKEIWPIPLPTDENINPALDTLEGVLTFTNSTSKKNISFEVNVPKKQSRAESLWMLCFFALIGGLILNLMPCVLPILSLKVLSLVKDQSLGPPEKKRQAWAYTVGVLCSFLILALSLSIFKSLGQELGWGFQLQNPTFVYYMALLFYLMGLSLLGFFHIGERWMGLGQGLTQSRGLKSSFFTGVLAVLVSTPCTAPFMGVAIGTALSLGILPNLLIFGFLGLGMAFPYLIFAYQPHLQRILPKPGLWMERLKELLAFPLLATSLWLLSVLGTQIDLTIVILGLGLFLLCTFALWLKKSTGAPKIIGTILLITSLLFPAYWLSSIDAPSTNNNADSTSVWQAFSEEAVGAELKNGRSVFVDYTALWCVTCQVNKKVALERADVLEAFKTKNVALFRADWTKKDPEITRSLEKFGRRSVPTYILHIPNKNPHQSPESRILPELLSISIVLNELEKVPTNVIKKGE